MCVPYARIWWPSNQGSSPLELESADPRSLLTSLDTWEGALTGKGPCSYIDITSLKPRPHSPHQAGPIHAFRLGAGQESTALQISLRRQAISDGRSARNHGMAPGEVPWPPPSISSVA